MLSVPRSLRPFKAAEGITGEIGVVLQHADRNGKEIRAQEREEYSNWVNQLDLQRVSLGIFKSKSVCHG